MSLKSVAMIGFAALVVAVGSAQASAQTNASNTANAAYLDREVQIRDDGMAATIPTTSGVRNTVQGNRRVASQRTGLQKAGTQARNVSNLRQQRQAMRNTSVRPRNVAAQTRAQARRISNVRSQVNNARLVSPVRHGQNTAQVRSPRVTNRNGASTTPRTTARRIGTQARSVPLPRPRA